MKDDIKNLNRIPTIVSASSIQNIHKSNKFKYNKIIKNKNIKIEKRKVINSGELNLFIKFIIDSLR